MTPFTTAAFDPAWTNNGDLVFTAFEKFSFQIRVIKNVQRIIDTARTVALIDLHMKEKPWEAKSITGTDEVNRFKYQGDYSLDMAQSAISTDPVFGTSGGAAIALSDLLGNDQYYFLLYNTAQTQDELLSSFNLAVSRISQKQHANYAYGIYRFTGRRYDLTDKDEFYYERVFGGYFALSYPLTKFQRVEASVSLSNSNKDADIRIEDLGGGRLRRTMTFHRDDPRIDTADRHGSCNVEAPCTDNRGSFRNLPLAASVNFGIGGRPCRDDDRNPAQLRAGDGRS